MLTASGQSVKQNGQSLEFKGQASAWGHYNGDNPYPLYLGARIIPQANYDIHINNQKKLDFEASANLVGDMGWRIADSTHWNSKVSAYRLWARYSTQQLEIRLGLQKINFGSATLLRPLMWFDQVDPRDPLQLTDGVYGALGRYYFMNNANLWLWVLYGNNELKGWEMLKSNATIPEFGGRFQVPVPTGEAALTYHYRLSDSPGVMSLLPEHEDIPENRIGIDARFDKVLGFWFEGTWVNKGKDLGKFTNQQTFNIGVDYTFNIGNGLGILTEHLLTAFDEKAMVFDDAVHMTALSVNYSMGMFDNINAIVFYGWKDSKVYNFVNWSKQYDALSLHIMGYWNPNDYNMPLQGVADNLFAGKGIQLMLVYNL